MKSRVQAVTKGVEKYRFSRGLRDTKRAVESRAPVWCHQNDKNVNGLAGGENHVKPIPSLKMTQTLFGQAALRRLR
jgi:hypothetical protein